VQDTIQAHYDDTYSRKLMLEFKPQADTVLGEYLSAKGSNAIEQGPGAQARLKELREAYLAKAANPRMKRMLEERLGTFEVEAYDRMANHSRKEQYTLDKTTTESERDAAKNDVAMAYDDPAKQAAARAVGIAALDRLGKLEGWGIGPATPVTEVTIKVSAATGAQVKELLKKLPDGMTFELSLEKEDN
jgi:hypothetical protein